MISVAEARALVLAGAAPLEAERIALTNAADRVLATDVIASFDQPPFPTTSMDGYAFRAGERAYAVAGTSRAGEPFAGALRSDQALRVFTGAQLPDDFDTIIPQEDATFDGAGKLLSDDAKPGRYLRRAGLDFARGATVLSRTTGLNARALALAAAANAGVVHVVRKPRVGLLATGDELVPVGAGLRTGEIVASSIHAVASLVSSAGGEPVHLGIARDTPEDLEQRLSAACRSDLDILVTLGGASVGDHDHVKSALAAQGMTPGFWKIAMRPGKPLVFGTLGAMRILGLPGNPVSTFVCAKLFLEPLISSLLGLAPGPETETGILGADIGPNDHREDYVRALFRSGTVTPFLIQDSSMQSILAEANALLIRAPNASKARAGDACMFIRL
jgi:molybdopterin molybdotransferase